jgi:hypothetical protein
MKACHNGTFYTELGRLIRANDLLNDIKSCLNDYKQFQKNQISEGRTFGEEINENLEILRLEPVTS